MTPTTTADVEVPPSGEVISSPYHALARANDLEVGAMAAISSPWPNGPSPVWKSMTPTRRAAESSSRAMARTVRLLQVGVLPPKKMPSGWVYWPPLIAPCRP